MTLHGLYSAESVCVHVCRVEWYSILEVCKIIIIVDITIIQKTKLTKCIIHYKIQCYY